MGNLGEHRDKLIVAALHLQCTRMANEYCSDNPHAGDAEEFASDMLDEAATSYVKLLLLSKVK